MDIRQLMKPYLTKLRTQKIYKKRIAEEINRFILEAHLHRHDLTLLC